MLTRESLEKMGLEKEKIDEIMKQHGAAMGKAIEAEKATAAGLQKQLDELNSQFVEINKKAEGNSDLQKQIEEMQAAMQTAKEAADKAQAEAEQARNEAIYTQAMTKHLEGVSFTSKAAKIAYQQQLKEKYTAVEDGNIVGAEQFLSQQKESDPGAFGQPRSGGEPRRKAPAGSEEDAFIAAARKAAGLTEGKEV